MKPSTIDGLLTGAMATTAMAGSISGLVHFAGEGSAYALPVLGVMVPLGTFAFVAGIDGLAISLTRQVHRDHGIDWIAATGLILITLVSMTLQVLAVLDDGWKAWVVHGSPAPAAGIAAAFFFRQRGRERSEGRPPPPAVPGGLTVETSAPGQGQPAAAAPDPAPEVPLEPPSPQSRKTPPARGTQASGGRGGRVRSSTGPARTPLVGDELATAVARRLMEQGDKLSKRKVDVAVRAINGTCSTKTRDEVYAALLTEEAMTPIATDTKDGD